jgi:hypothetical protein
MPGLLQRLLQAMMQTAAACLTAISNQAHLPSEFRLKLKVESLGLLIIWKEIKALFTRQVAPYGLSPGNNLGIWALDEFHENLRHRSNISSHC